MRRFLIFVVLLLTPGIIYAQGPDLSEPWPIVERCVFLETTPPPDWLFRGTLVLTSTRGLHAYRQEWDTPRITAFYPSSFLDTALSPDSRLYAIVEGTSKAYPAATEFWTTLIRVVDTQDGALYSIPWEDSYTAMHRVIGHRLYWVDDTHLLYSRDDDDQAWYIIDPFTAETAPWNHVLSPTHFVFELAPDGEKGLSAEWAYPFWTIHSFDRHVDVSLTTSYDALWHPSSEYFVSLTWPQDSAESQSLLMFDLGGEIEHYVYQMQPESHDLYSMAWSPDGRYLAFVDGRLYLADLEAQTVIDTCMVSTSYAFSLAWSPDSTQLATIDRGNPDRAIRILHVEEAVSYIVGYHQGDVIGWRADDE